MNKISYHWDPLNSLLQSFDKSKSSDFVLCPNIYESSNNFLRFSHWNNKIDCPTYLCKLEELQIHTSIIYFILSQWQSNF